MTTNETKTHEVVRDSSKNCEAYNEANKSAIEAGLVLPRIPDSHILQQEEEQKAFALKRDQNATDALIVARKLDPAAELETDTSTYRFRFKLPTLGIRAEIEADTSNIGRYSPSTLRPKSWKLTMGNIYAYGRDRADQKTWMTVGTGGILVMTAAQLHKATIKATSVAKILKDIKTDRESKEAAEERYRAFYNSSDDAKELIKAITGESYISEYSSGGLQVLEDGRLYHRLDTFTVDQWRQIVALKQKHAAAIAEQLKIQKSEMDALKTRIAVYING